MSTRKAQAALFASGSIRALSPNGAGIIAAIEGMRGVPCLHAAAAELVALASRLSVHGRAGCCEPLRACRGLSRGSFSWGMKNDGLSAYQVAAGRGNSSLLYPLLGTPLES